LRRVDAVHLGNIGPQRQRGAVGVPIPVDSTHLGGERVTESVGWREGRFVGVEAHLDVDLSRVVALERTKVVTNGYHAW
jgi:hypothetical protein